MYTKSVVGQQCSKQRHLRSQQFQAQSAQGIPLVTRVFWAVYQYSWFLTRVAEERATNATNKIASFITMICQYFKSHISTYLAGRNCFARPVTFALPPPTLISQNNPRHNSLFIIVSNLNIEKNRPMTPQTILLLALVGVALTATAELPLSFKATVRSRSLVATIQMAPGHEVLLRSPRLQPKGNHWVKLTSRGTELAADPTFDPQSVLFNLIHEGNYLLALHDQAPHHHQITQGQLFHFVEAQLNEKSYGLLLPLFRHQMPSIRVDSLFRCEDAIVSVDWTHGDAHIAIFSHENHRWTVLQNIDDGYENVEHGIRYGYAVDKGHTHPVKVQIANKGHCLINKETQPVKIKHEWNRDLYDFTTVLNLLGQSLPLRSSQSGSEQL